MKLLRLISDSVKRFVVADHFKVGTTDGVKIAFLGDNFKANFLAKVEEGVESADLKPYQLLEPSVDGPIIEELGENHETKLSDLWDLLKKQPSGQSGLLLTNGYANIFYIRDAKGKLWAVDARWRGDGWCVLASSVGDPDRWHAGYRVFSR